MSILKVKKLIAMVLIVSMTITSSAFVTLADSIDDVVSTTTQNEEKTKKYVVDTDDNVENIIKEDDDSKDDHTNFATSSEADDDADDTDSGNLSDEPEDEDGTDTATISDAEEEEKTDVNTGDEAEEDEDTATTSDAEEEEKTNVNTDDDKEDDNGIDTATTSNAEDNKDNEAEDNDTKTETATISDVDDTEKDDITATDSDADITIEKKYAEEVKNDEIVASDSSVRSILKDLIVATLSETSQNLFGAAPVVGGTIMYGYYPQAVNSAVPGAENIVDPIKWRVLQVSADRALLISDKLLERKRYHSTFTPVTWATSDLRVWLNNDFKNKAFNEDELIGIATVTNINPNNPTHGTDGGPDTEDKIFLLSYGEATRSLTSPAARIAHRTNWTGSTSADYWWLRTPGTTQEYAAVINSSGNPRADGINVEATMEYARPAIYIDLTSPIFTAVESNIIWNLGIGPGVSFIANSEWTNMTSYREGFVTKLPTAENLDPVAGYEVVGWKISNDGGVTYGDIVQEIPNTTTGNIIVSVGFAPAITWEENSGTWVPGYTASTSYIEGRELILPTSDDIKRTGYRLRGWEIMNGADIGTIITKIPATRTGVITLRAAWDEEIYDINYYVASDSNIIMKTATRSYTETKNLDAEPSWTKTGYHFSHWAVKGTNVATTSVPAYTAKNIDIYPVWIDNMIGTELYFGTFPQAVSNTTPGAENIVDPIKWRVIDKTGNKAFLASDKLLFSRPYNTVLTDVTWATCDLRTYLNNDFFYRVFNEDERIAVATNTNINNYSPGPTTPGPNTEDRVFIHSDPEVCKYYTTAIQIRYRTNYTGSTAAGDWWLRNPGSALQQNAMRIVDWGAIHSYGQPVNTTTIFVRPCIYIDVTSPVFSGAQSKLNWDLNGGTFITYSEWPNIATYSEGVVTKLPTNGNLVARPNYTLEGWRISNDGGTTFGDVVKEIPKTTGGPITLRAGWSCPITWQENSGTWVAGYTATTSYIEEDELTLPTKDHIKRTGYILKGWEVMNGADVGTVITKIPVTRRGPITLRATWNEVVYNINYYESSTSDVIRKTTTRSYTESKTLDAEPSWTKTGYHFSHWAVKGTNVATTSVPAYTATDSNVYPVWIDNMIGTELYFGTFPQAVSNTTPGADDIVDPIKWRVIDKTGDKAFLVANKLLFDREYNTVLTDVTWATCDLRTYLNNDFLYRVFNEDERIGIATNTNINNYSPGTTNPGPNTEDRVFILSDPEVMNYYPSIATRIINRTNYTGSLAADSWWIRNPGSDLQQNAERIGDIGLIHAYGQAVTTKNYIRPAIYIDVTSPVFSGVQSKLNWDLNGGTFITYSEWPNIATYSEGVVTKLPTNGNLVARPDYTLAGWRINNSSTVYTEIPKNVKGNINLKAAWSRPITWVDNGGTWVSGYTASTSYIEGSELILPTKDDFKKTGYTLRGWNLNGTGVVTKIPATQLGNVTLEAEWDENVYNINYYLSNSSDVIKKTTTRRYTEEKILDTNPDWAPIGKKLGEWRVKGTSIATTSVPAYTASDSNVYPHWVLDVSTGSEIIQGEYPQTSTKSNVNDPIVWVVIANNGNTATLMSKKILDAKGYHNTDESITWEDSDLRTWLNADFYDKAFNAGEKTSIYLATNSNPDNPSGIDGGNDTKDNVFVLSFDEINNYLISDNLKLATGSDYAKFNGLEVENIYSPWWSRSPGDAENKASYMKSDASLDTLGKIVADRTYGVRPIIKIDLSSPYFDINEGNIVWDLNGGEWIDGSTWPLFTRYKEGTRYVLPVHENIKERTGYIFAGWSINGNAATEIGSSSRGDLTITANWDECSYEIDYYESTVSSIIKKTVTRLYSEGIVLDTNASWAPEGYLFDYWVDMDSNNKITRVSAFTDRNVRVYPVWKKDEPVPPGPTPPGPTPRPTPTPTPVPSGPSGGGGGTIRGGGIIQEQDRAINFVMQTPIYENEYTWVYDNQGRRTGINLNVDSTIGKAMLKSVRTKGAYALSQDCKTMQLGGGGIYRIYDKGDEGYYGFDKYNKLMTGFVETSANTKMLSVALDSVTGLVGTENVDSDKIFFENKAEAGKYYLYELDGIMHGRLWCQPIVIKGIQYTFDLTGKVISSVDSSIDQGIWEYNPLENHWRYFVPDTDGKARYYKNGTYDIYYNGHVKKYTFDDNGNVIKEE